MPLLTEAAVEGEEQVPKGRRCHMLPTSPQTHPSWGGRWERGCTGGSGPNASGERGRGTHVRPGWGQAQPLPGVKVLGAPVGEGLLGSPATTAARADMVPTANGPGGPAPLTSTQGMAGGHGGLTTLQADSALQATQVSSHRPLTPPTPSNILHSVPTSQVGRIPTGCWGGPGVTSCSKVD